MATYFYAVILFTATFLGPSLGQYGPPTKGKKHHVTVTSTLPPDVANLNYNPISTPLPDNSIGSTPEPARDGSFLGASFPVVTPSQPAHKPSTGGGCGGVGSGCNVVQPQRDPNNPFPFLNSIKPTASGPEVSCTASGYFCVSKENCINGVTTTTGIQTTNCNTQTFACCRFSKQNIPVQGGCVGVKGGSCSSGVFQQPGSISGTPVGTRPSYYGPSNISPSPNPPSYVSGPQNPSGSFPSNSFQPGPGSSVPGSNGIPIGGSIYDGTSYPVTQSPYEKPYTGPLNTTPHPGCAAALKCVPETYCDAEGVMVSQPVFLTREQAENRVPMTDCQDPDTGIIGKCCRDPNYKDPWPGGMMNNGDITECSTGSTCKLPDECGDQNKVRPFQNCLISGSGNSGMCCYVGGQQSGGVILPTGVKPLKKPTPGYPAPQSKPLPQQTPSIQPFPEQPSSGFSSQQPFPQQSPSAQPFPQKPSSTQQFPTQQTLPQKFPTIHPLPLKPSSTKPIPEQTPSQQPQQFPVIKPLPQKPSSVRPFPQQFPTQQSPSAQPFPQQPSSAQPFPQQPSSAQPFPQQTPSAQPFPQRPSSAQPFPQQFPTQQSPSAQPFPQQPSSAQPFPQQTPSAQPFPQQPSSAQPFPQQFPTQQSPSAQPFPQQPSSAQPFPQQTPSAQPFPQRPSSAQPFPQQTPSAQPFPQQPSSVQPFPPQQPSAQPFPQQPSSVQPFPQQVPSAQPFPYKPPSSQTFPQQSSGTQYFPNQSPSSPPFSQTPSSAQPLPQHGSTAQPFPQKPSAASPFPQQSVSSQGFPQKPSGIQPFPQQLPSAQSPGAQPYPRPSAKPSPQQPQNSQLFPQQSPSSLPFPQQQPQSHSPQGSQFVIPGTSQTGSYPVQPSGSQPSQSSVPQQQSGYYYTVVPGEKCGVRRPVNRQGLANTDAGFSEFPWHALIIVNSNQSALCSAAIVSDRAVVTAAHCLQNLESSDISVKAGVWKLHSADQPKPVQEIQAAAIARHPKFDASSLFNDLAVVLLEEPLHFDEHVDRICFPPSQPDISQYSECIATGWGKAALQGNVHGSIMHQIPVQLIPSSACQKKLQQTYLGQHFKLNPSFQCAVPIEPAQDLCKVDVGGPIACHRGDLRYELHGVYSWDVGCTTKQNPSAFGSIDTDWITSVLSRPIDDVAREELNEILKQQQQQELSGVDIDSKPGFSQGYGKK